MSTHTSIHEGERRFLAMISAVIVIAVMIVATALYMYVSSGAIQVDLSRPAVEAARKRAAQNSQQMAAQEFSADGELNEDVYAEFLEQYDKALYNATTSELFIPAPISDESLRLDVISKE